MVIKVSNGYNNILSCKEHFNQCLASVKPAYKSGSTTNAGRKHKFGGLDFGVAFPLILSLFLCICFCHRDGFIGGA